MMHRLTTYFHVIVPVAVPIFWTDWGIYVVLTIMTTCLITNTIIATESYSEPTISKIMKTIMTIMTRCEKFRIFETTSKSRKKMKIRTNRNCKYSRCTSTDKRRRTSSKLSRIKCKKKRRSRECTKEKSIHDQLYMCRTSNSCKRTYKPRILHFDTYSFTIGVDDHYSYCICNNSDLFITYIIPTKYIFVKGINGNLPIRGRGTVRWKMTDD